MIQHLHPFYNFDRPWDGTNRHPTRSVRLIDTPSVLFACDSFAVPLTECTMTLCGQRDSVTTRSYHAALLPAG
jgi:hypothetical protein